MPAPDFLIIGAQKAGSTWLSHNLGRHPDVFLPEPEIHFFDKVDRFRQGQVWYESHFEDSHPRQRIGEKTPDYLWTTSDGAEGHRAGVHQRIHTAYPNVRFIVTLRNPVDRALSALNHLMRTGRLSPLHDAEELLLGKKRNLIQGHGVIEKGRYYPQIQAYLDLFDREQFFFVLFEEDIVKTPVDTFRSLCQFLDVDPERGPSPEHLRKKVYASRRSLPGLLLQYYLGLPRMWMKALDRALPSYRASLSPEDRRRLHVRYESENHRLFSFLDRTPSVWTGSHTNAS